MAGTKLSVRSCAARAGAAALAALCMCTVAGAAAQGRQDFSEWTIYITNDNCPDYTWGYTERQTRKSFADIVRGHLDEMNRTDDQEPHNRDRYNMAVTQEALCFVEHYPHRKDELIRRIKEGRVYVSPYLCNSLWAFQSVEGAIRTFYPARRLERQWGIRMDVAEHIELPSLPWGAASILAGCGIRWLSNPYYGYDSTFSGLENPPLFILEGPDGSTIRVVMDKWACSNASYMQGKRLLADPDSVTKRWLPHYAGAGKEYPLREILASGTHGDINPGSGGQASGFADAIIKFNARGGEHPKLVNATLPQFCEAVDNAQAKEPFLQTLRGCFGHSWDLWPVSLAKYVAAMREGERRFLAAEALLAVADDGNGRLREETRADRQRAEWCLAMLSDHAWNGTNDTNKRHNAELRRKWSEELNQLADALLKRGWSGTGLERDNKWVTLFNGLSVSRRGLVRIERPGGISVTDADGKSVNCQVETEDAQDVLYFVSPQVTGFGFERLRLETGPAGGHNELLHVTETELESPYYTLRVDTTTGGIASLVHKASGNELVVDGRSLFRTTYFAGRKSTLKDIRTEIAADGPVLARLKLTGAVEGIEVTNLVTVYAELDRVDFDVRIDKPVTTRQERLCHVFSVMREGAVLRVETTGAVVRPKPQPAGDLLPGADTRRLAVQGFVDASVPGGPGVTIAPLDAFALRLDLGQITFEALGNDQNYREVVRDQNRERHFRFRYSLRAHTGGYNNAEAFSWSRSAASPLLAKLARIGQNWRRGRSINVDATRAVATCLKPADDKPPGGAILRLWEVAGNAAPVTMRLRGYKKAVLTDLLERDQKQTAILNGSVALGCGPYGFCSVRLLP